MTDDRPDRPAPLLFVAHTPNVSGAEAVLLKVIDEAVGRGHPVTLACPQGPLHDRVPPTVGVLTIPDLSLSGQRGIARGVGLARLAARWVRVGAELRRAVRTRGETVIVNSTLALPVARFVPGGVTWLAHDMLVTSAQRAAVRLGRAGVRHAVVLTPPAVDVVAEYGIDGVLVPLSVDLPASPPPLRPLGAEPVVGIMGSITPWKGHDVLLEALAQAPGVRLEIAGRPFPGDEEYVRSLVRRSAAADLAGRVRFLGQVDPYPTLRRWDALVSASVLPEPGPTVMYEAMSVTVPVVGPAHGGAGAALADERGVRYGPGDVGELASAIVRITSDNELRARVAARASDSVRHDHDNSVNIPRMLEELIRAR